MKKSISEIQLENFAHNIKLLRKRNAVSKKEAARMLGIGAKALTKLENGHIPPLLRADVLFNTRDIFGVSVCDLLKSRLDEQE